MKMVKKILLGTLAVAAILSIASCKREEGGNSELIQVNAASKKASIDYTNDSDSVTRGFKTLQTKHLDAICHIETTVTDLVDKTVNGNKIVSSGTMGYIFDLVESEDKTAYSFTIAGARYNQVAGTIEAYVESFKNIAKDKVEETLTGGIHATGDKTWGTNDFGCTLVSKNELKSLLDSQTTTPKKLDLWIDVVAQGKPAGSTVAPTGRTGTPGSYRVSFFWKDPVRTNASTYHVEYGDTTGHIIDFEVKKENVNAQYDATKGIKSMQSDVGFYANVYAGQTLKGEWQFDKIVAEAEEIEE